MNERRRTLLFSPSNIPTENGVYIESVDHEFYLPDDWDTANIENSIAVVTDAHKFRIALFNTAVVPMNSTNGDQWETKLSGTTNSGITDYTIALTEGLTDYNGATNTQLIVTKCQPSTSYAAGACNAYTFRDGVTKGYLPALGELYLAYQNKNGVNAALEKCENRGRGSTLSDDYYWSSTFRGKLGGDLYCWTLSLSDGNVTSSPLNSNLYVRAFAPLEDSN